MKYTPGDKIRMKHTGEEGMIIDYLNAKMVEVNVNGTIFPVHIEDVEHPYLKWFTDKTTKKKTTSQKEELPVERTPEKRLSKGISLSFIPVFKTIEMEEQVDFFKIFLLNETPFDIKFSYDFQLNNKSEFAHEGALHSFGNLYMHNVDFVTMNDQPRFNWKLTNATNPNTETEEGTLRIRASKVFEHISELMKKNEPSFGYMLINEFKPKKKPEPKEKYIPNKKPGFATLSSPTKEQPKHEVDLHIEQIVANTKRLSNTDIIQIQLDTLEYYINLAIANRQELMIVIHGLGKGTLKEEVHKVLKRIPQVSRYKNEWSSKYGFGATEVWFRYL